MKIRINPLRSATLSHSHSRLFQLGVLSGLVCLGLLGAQVALAQVTDDFNDGDDVGWSLFAPFSPPSVTFPAGGYRLSGDSGDRLAISYRMDANLQDFVTSVEITDWTDVNQLFGIFSRLNVVGGQPSGFLFYCIPMRTGIPDSLIGMVRVDSLGSTPDIVSGVWLTLEHGKTYRMVFAGVGASLTGQMFELTPGGPVLLDTVAANDANYPSGGANGVLVYDRTGGEGSMDATFDNFSAIPAATSPTTFVVTTTADSGPGSLRQAILDANANSGTDTIEFNIPEPEPHTIQPLTQLPEITRPVIIDGTSQPGFSGAPIVQLDGTSSGDEASGLVITAGGSTVRGLVITRFHLSGIRLEGTAENHVGGNRILGNYVGVGPDGLTTAGNGVNTLPQYPDPAGILVLHSDGNIIGDGTPTGRNIISGNKWGVNIQEGSTNTIDGNYVGTDVTGTHAVPNAGGIRPPEYDNGYFDEYGNLLGYYTSPTAAGIRIDYASDNTVRGNVISGNTTDVSTAAEWSGFWQQACGVFAANADRTQLLNNRIGTEASGAAPVPNQFGAWVFGNNGISRGNVISANHSAGLFISGQEHSITGNLIGTDASGTSALGNGDNGIVFYIAENCTIGGTTPDARNVISGNGGYGGIAVFSGGGHRIVGNFIGTDVTGTKALGVQAEGMIIIAPNNIIGGTLPAERNIISGNGTGVDIRGNENKVQGNFIGTDLSGTVALPNQMAIYLADAATNNLIGGASPGAGNLLSGNNAQAAIFLNGIGVSETLIQGNFIGTDLTGTAPLGDSQATGVWIAGSADTFTGGASPGEGNTIAFHLWSGVVVENYLTPDGWTLRNTIVGNSIFANGTMGIDLAGDGSTLNDPLDGDIGPNNLQNFPTITSASASLGGIQIQGTFNSTPNTTFILDFYANSTVHPSGYGEGETYLGAVDVTTDLDGGVSFTVSLPVTVAAGQIITATATDPDGNTSEFSGQSPPVTSACSITCPASLTVNAGPDATECGAVVVFPLPTLDGVCGEVNCVPPSGSFFPVGTMTVRCATIAGANCEFTVTVVDKTPPQIAPPANITISCSSDLMVPVTFSVTASDNCDPVPIVSCSPPSGSGFPVGTTTVTCTATDASGNSSTQTFTVTRAALDFAGFLPPIGGADTTGGGFGNPVRTFKNGSTIPVKFTASCDGSPVLTGVHRLQAIKYSDATTAAAPIDATPQDAATTGNQFRLADSQWHFNLDTKAAGMTPGIWQLVATLSDGSQHHVWIQIK